jgi:hypothetical protein
MSSVDAPARSGDVRRSVGDIHRAKKQLGYSPGTNLDEDLRLGRYRIVFVVDKARRTINIPNAVTK